MTTGDRLPAAAIVGATAVGKTEIAIDVAERLDAEIVSVDSMQAYRGMDIGTAKPSAAQLRRVRHHLIDVVEPSHELTAAEFQGLARAAIEDIAARRKLPLLVGGSGLYFRAVVDDLRFPPSEPGVRARLQQKVDEEGPAELHALLRKLDRAAAERIEPSNARRTIRALEVIELTGRPFSESGRWSDYDSSYDLKVAGLTRDRSELYARIEARVRTMIEAGLLAEAAELEARGLSRAARQALGYRQVLAARPGDSPDELRAAIVAATKRFARRQESWWRSDPRVVWHDASQDTIVATLIEMFTPLRNLRRPG